MHRYPEMMVAPLRRQLTELGAEPLRTAAAVDTFLEQAQAGTALLVVDSVCGCSAGTMRPAVTTALQRGPRPAAFGTVFAGADLEATARAREHLAPYPPSSPAVALFRDGQLVFMLERHQIKGKPVDAVAAEIGAALQEHGL
jgi:putative YphP/YqiW family bacilliredoxin